VAPFDGGGARTLIDIYAQDGGLGDPRNLKYDNGYVYFASPFRNEVQRLPADGGLIETLAGGMSSPYYIVLDAKFVYVAEYSTPHPICHRVPPPKSAPIQRRRRRWFDEKKNIRLCGWNKQLFSQSRQCPFLVEVDRQLPADR